MMRHLRITVDGRAYDVVVEDVTQAGTSTTTPMPGPYVPPVGATPAPMASSPVAGTGGSSGTPASAAQSEPRAVVKLLRSVAAAHFEVSRIQER